jgi:hypothetical protein
MTKKKATSQTEICRFDVFDTTDDRDAPIELAHNVSAKVASELSGIPVAWIEDSVVKHGEMGILNCSLEGDGQELFVRRSRDES